MTTDTSVETKRNGDERKKESRELPILIIVIPCYNEEEVLPITAPMFLNELEILESKDLISDGSSILFVDDGSKDDTWNIIQTFSKVNPRFSGIRLSRNRGHQNALLCGLMEARKDCDITISIDCDGQDDISAMEEMVTAWHNGSDIVYGVRDNRDSDTFFKRTSAQAFYKFMKFMGVETVYNHADYRLADSRVLDGLAKFQEVNLFLRGMFPLVGYNSSAVYYSRNKRLKGKSHYPLSKMVALGADGITSLSTKPIRMILMLGVFSFILSLIFILYGLISFLLNTAVPGWTSSFIIISFLGGIQMISIGLIGEYIGKVYMEVKQRPRYIIAEKTDAFDPSENSSAASASDHGMNPNKDAKSEKGVLQNEKKEKEEKRE